MIRKGIILPKYSVDFHIHILHDIDDGSSCLEESVKMAGQLCKNNINTAVASPHFIKGLTDYKYRKLAKKRFDELKYALKQENIPLKLYFGFEVKAAEDLLYLDYIKSLVIGRTDYMLLEAPFLGEPFWLDELVYNLIALKINPIIVHPERCEYFQKNIGRLKGLVEQNVLLQINIGSFLGLYGKAARKTAVKILNEKMVHLIGSDAHSTYLYNIIPKENKIKTDNNNVSVCNIEKTILM